MNSPPIPPLIDCCEPLKLRLGLEEVVTGLVTIYECVLTICGRIKQTHNSPDLSPKSRSQVRNEGRLKIFMNGILAVGSCSSSMHVVAHKL